MQDDTSKRSARRAVLGAGIAGLGVAAGVTAASRAQAQEKIPQAMVMYQLTPQGDQRCDNCVHWQPPNACAIVSGVILPQAWCGVWAAKPS